MRKSTETFGGKYPERIRYVERLMKECQRQEKILHKQLSKTGDTKSKLEMSKAAMEKALYSIGFPSEKTTAFHWGDNAVVSKIYSLFVNPKKSLISSSDASRIKEITRDIIEGKKIDPEKLREVHNSIPITFYPGDIKKVSKILRLKNLQEANRKKMKPRGKAE